MQASLCGVSRLFPLREGDVIGVLHKTVTDWLTARRRLTIALLRTRLSSRWDAAHRRLARACARTIRAGVLHTEAH